MRSVSLKIPAVSVGLFMLVMCALSAAAQAEDAEAEAKNKDKHAAVLQAFKDAGYAFHGQAPGFSATSPPARTEFDIIIAGYLPSPGPRQQVAKNKKALWRVEAGEIDSVGAPDVKNGYDRWGRFAIPHRSGAIYGTAYKSRGGQTDRYIACMITDQDELITIKTPACSHLTINDVNAEGQVVGYIYDRKYIPFIWSKDAGYQALPGTGARYTAPLSINKSGVIAGYTRDTTSKPILWLPPKEKDGAYTIKTLDIPKGFESAACKFISDKGEVLVEGLTPKKFGTRHYLISTPYLWTPGKGYTPLPPGKHSSESPYAINSDGDILMMGSDIPEIDNLPLSFTSYLFRDGKKTRLPDYPGAVKTSYRYMSDEGLIVGSAWFEKDKTGPAGAKVLTFLISVKK